MSNHIDIRNKKLSPLKPLLNEWIKIHESFHIKKTLSTVRKEAASTIKEDKGESLGIVFAVPYIPLNESKNINNSLASFLKELEEVEYDIMAYTFPCHCRSLKSEKYIYPGVALVGTSTR